MGDDDAKFTFALVIKRWFAANGWPQKITDDWAKDPGVQAPNGPWASQICAALKVDFHPRVEFFVAIARFNQFIADQELKGVKGKRLRDRLHGAKPLLDDAGHLYGATEFFALFTGLTQPPSDYANNALPTQEELDAQLQKDQAKFRQWALNEMMSRSEAWEILKAQLSKDDRIESEHLPLIQEKLAGLSRITPEEMPEGWWPDCPVRKALETLAA